MMVRTALCFALAGFWTHVAIAQEPRIDWKAGEVRKYRYQIEEDSTGQGGGLTSKTSQWENFYFSATPGEPNDKGLIPVKVQLDRYEASIPDSDLSGLHYYSFTSDKYDGRSLLRIMFMPGVAAMRTPITLLYTPEGLLSEVQGAEQRIAELTKLLNQHYRNDPAYENTLYMFQQLGKASALKRAWEDVFIADLPNDFQPEQEWKEQEVIRVPSFYSAWVNATNVAKANDDGTLNIESELDLPKSQQATVRTPVSTMRYYIKNGTGSGKAEIGKDGWVSKSDTTIHCYYHTAIIVGAQELPMEFYRKTRVRVWRK